MRSKQKQLSTSSGLVSNMIMVDIGNLTVSDKMDISTPANVAVLLSRLSNSTEDELSKVIVDLEILAGTISSSYSEELSQSDLGPFLQTLPTLSGNKKTCALRLVGKIFRLMYPKAVLSKYAEIFSDGLRGSSDSEVKIVYLKYLIFCCSTHEGKKFLVEDLEKSTSPILCLVANNMKAESINVAKNAAEAMQRMFIHSDNFPVTLSEPFMQIFGNLLQGGAVVRFRVYQLFVDLIKINGSLMENEKIYKILFALAKELENDDILSHLNCLEMLSTLASFSMKGLEMVTELGILERLRCLFVTTDLDPLKQLLLPGAVKFFGSLATAKPSIVLQRYPDFEAFVFENANGDDIVLKVICFETLASICSADKGINLLYHTNPENLKKFMSVLGRSIQSPVDEALKSRMIDTLKAIFAKHNEMVGKETSDIKHELFRQLSDQPVKLLMSCSQLPFSKIRFNALGSINAIASYSWAEKDILETPGFLEYLLDRQTEQEKEGKELKYNILKSLAQSATARESLGHEYYDKIGKYVLEGPIYSEQQTAIEFQKLN